MTEAPASAATTDKFLLTCLLRGMTFTIAIGSISAIVSTHMPLARHDDHCHQILHIIQWFLLTCLLRGMTLRKTILIRTLRFLLTCLLRGMTQMNNHCDGRDMFLLTCLLRGMTHTVHLPQSKISVSTHMPLARHDLYAKSVGTMMEVSTHMPLARHDSLKLPLVLFPAEFLLTCLLRGMTPKKEADFESFLGFYSHASCEA